MQKEKVLPKVEHDGNIMIALGGSRKEIHWRNKNFLWSEFVKKLSIPTRTPETFAEYKSFPKAKRDEVKDVGGFVGGTLKGGRRRATSVAWRSIVTLDLDSVPSGKDIWPSIEMLMDCAAVMYSTHSHSPEAPRLRIIIPLSRQVTCDEYSAISRKLAEDIGIDMCDDTTYEAHRLMYWPSCSHDAEYRFEFSDGPWLNVDTQLARYTDWSDSSQWPVSSRRTVSIEKLAKKQGNPTSKTGIVGAFCRTYSIEEAIENFLPDVYTPCDNGRYTYAKGSTIGGLVLYDNGIFAYSNHGTDPAGGILCNAFDLVRIHLFGDLDIDSVETGAKLPSFAAMCEFASKDDRVKLQLLNFDDAEWSKELEFTSKGKIVQTVSNIVLILENDLNIKGSFAFNDFKARPEVTSDLPWQIMSKRLTNNWLDSDDAGLRDYLERKYGIDHMRKIKDALSIVLMRHRFHPVQDYLNSLVWDKIPRAETLFIDYLGADDTHYTRVVTKCALIGAVARILKPGCKHDHMLVLIGPQGCGKSTTLAKLGGEWFSDSLYTINGKEAYEQIQGYWIIEMGEMAATRKAELESIKQFISKQSDTFRMAYAERTQEHPRQCAFFGTTNDNEFLHDYTGNRRFWPLVVSGSKCDVHKVFDADLVNQIWAESVFWYKSGEQWHLNREDEAEAKKHQIAHTEVSALSGQIQEFLDIPITEDWYEKTVEDRAFYIHEEGFTERGNKLREMVCALEVWQELYNGDPKQFTLSKARELNSILRGCEGWEERNRLNFGPPYGRQRGFVRTLKMNNYTK